MSSCLTVRWALQEEVSDSLPSCWAVFAVGIVSLLNPMQIEIQRDMIRTKLVNETGMSPVQVRYQLVKLGRVKIGIDGAQPISAGRFL